MLSKVNYKLDNLPASLYDLDITPSGGWIGTTEYGERQSLCFDGKALPLPRPFRFPHTRAINDEVALVIDSRTRSLEKNAWMITSSGHITACFYAGDAVQDVLASSKFIVVTYFDESACTSPGIEGNGVAIFDLKGSFLFGYTSLFGDDAADVCDCYAACLTGESSLLFFPYTD